MTDDTATPHSRHDTKEERATPRPLIDSALSLYLSNGNITLKQLSESHGISFKVLQKVAQLEHWQVQRAEVRERERKRVLARRIKSGEGAIETLRRDERKRAARLARAIDRRLAIDEAAHKDGSRTVGVNEKTGAPILSPDILTAGELCKLANSAEALQRILYRSHNLATEHHAVDVFQHFPQDEKTIDARYRVTEGETELQRRATDAEVLPSPEAFALSFMSAGAPEDGGTSAGGDNAERGGREAGRQIPAGGSGGDCAAGGYAVKDPSVREQVVLKTGGVGGKYSMAIEQPVPSGANVIFQNSGSDEPTDGGDYDISEIEASMDRGEELEDEVEGKDTAGNEELLGWLRSEGVRADIDDPDGCSDGASGSVEGASGEGGGDEDGGGVPEGDEGSVFEG